MSDVPPLHISVLPKETLKYWISNPRGTYVDLTLGMGGHSLALLEAHPEARLIAFDWDQESMALAQKHLRSFGDRVHFINENFAMAPRTLKSMGVEQVNGVLFDLGPSTYQILHACRGLTYQKDESLDMRMAPKLLPFPASTFLNRIGEPELAQVLRDFGEIQPGLARRLAKSICHQRANGGAETTEQLVSAVLKVSSQRDLLARVFQALRIVINGELANLTQILNEIWTNLARGARVVGISFHSLEDRMVKNAFEQAASSGRAEIITKKPVMATPEEIRSNPKSRSAKLRCAQSL